MENAAAAAADRKHIRNGLEELYWVASLKPSSVGIPAPVESGMSEIAVLAGQLRADARAARLEELIHRSVPYAVVLILGQDGDVRMSAARKRPSLADGEAVVLVGDVIGAWCGERLDDKVAERFLEALPLAAQPSTDLGAVYMGWLDALLAINAEHITGEFRRMPSPDAIINRQRALAGCVKLEREMVRLRSATEGERQLARRVELNLELKRVKGEFKALADQL